MSVSHGWDLYRDSWRHQLRRSSVMGEKRLREYCFGDKPLRNILIITNRFKVASQVFWECLMNTIHVVKCWPRGIKRIGSNKNKFASFHQFEIGCDRNSCKGCRKKMILYKTLKVLILSLIVGLKSNKALCDCGGTIKPKMRNGESAYTSVKITTFKCSRRNCQKGFFHGFSE